MQSISLNAISLQHTLCQLAIDGQTLAGRGRSKKMPARVNTKNRSPALPPSAHADLSSRQVEPELTARTQLAAGPDMTALSLDEFL